MVGHHPAEFGIYRIYGSGDTMFLICHKISQDHVTQNRRNCFADMFLVCHTISQDHVIKRSCDFIGTSPTS